MHEAPTQDWIGWAAGLFEGEGCFGWQKDTSGRRYPRATLAMTDPDVVKRFHEVVGVGRMYYRSEGRTDRGVKLKALHLWMACSAGDAMHVAEMFLPYLGTRRAAKARELLEFRFVRPRGQYHCDRPVEATAAGRQGHILRDEPICDRCRRSYNLYMKGFQQQRRDAAKAASGADASRLNSIDDAAQLLLPYSQASRGS